MFFLSLCPVANAWHWTPPSSTNFWETVWGYITGFSTIEAGDEIAAFRVDNDEIAGLTTISWDGSNFGYNMVDFAPDTSSFDVYYIVWDGSVELGAVPNFTAHPAEFGSGPTQHDVNHGQGGVPEPPTMIIMGISILLLCVFMLKWQHYFKEEKGRSVSSTGIG